MAEKSKVQLSTELTNFTIIHNEFIDSTLLNGAEKLVFIAIKRHLNSNNFQAFPSLKTICNHSGLSKPTVIKAISTLEQKKILVKVNRDSKEKGHQSNLYTLYDNKEMWQADSQEKLSEVAKRIQYEQAKRIVAEYEKEKELKSSADQSKDLSPNCISKDLIVVKTTSNCNTNNTECQGTKRYTEVQNGIMSYDEVLMYYDYESAIAMYPKWKKDYELVMDIIYKDVFSTTAETIKIGSEDKPTQVVISVFEKLSMENIIYAIETFHKQTTRIHNKRSYLMKILYNAKEDNHFDLYNLGHHNGDF